MNILNSTYIQTAGGLYRHQQLGILIDLTGDDSLLLVAAGHTAGDGNRPLTAAHVVLLDQTLRVLADIVSPQESGSIGEFRFKIPLQHQIVLQRIVQHKTVFVAILRDVGHTHDTTLANGCAGDVLAAHGYLAGYQRLKTRQTIDKFGLTVAVDTGDADDLALAYLQRYVLNSVILVNLTGYRHVLHIQDYIAGLPGLLLHMEIDIAAHHHGGQLLHRSVFCLYSTDVFAFAQYGASVSH